MEAFRQPEVFSSAATVDTLAMGAVRPLIPLQIDPPDHKKYRKILDPLFAPAARWRALEEPVAALVNDLIDGFIDRGEVDFAAGVLGAVPVAGVPHAARPAARRPRPVPEDEGRHHPARPRGRQAARRRRDGRLPERDRAVDLRLLQPRARRARGRATRRHPQPVPRRRGRRRAAHPRGHPRHLLPLPHRRPRHRDRLARLLLRLPRPSTPSSAAQIVADPSLIPSAVEELLRWETPVGGIIRVAAEDTELRGCPIKPGRHGEHQPRCRPTPTRPSSPTPTRCASTAR